MEAIGIILLISMIIEIAVLIFLSNLVKKEKYSKTKEKSLTLKEKLKTLRPEQYVIGALYLLIFLTAGYFFYANMFPDNPINTSGIYELSAGDLAPTSELRSLYLDKDYILGGKTEINNQPVKMIVSEEPFNIIFNPKKVILENATGKLELSFVDVNTDVYLNDQLIIPNLKEYEKIKDFTDTEVWVKKDLTLNNYIEANDPESFIYNNFPQNTIYSFAELSGGAPIIQDYARETTRIRTTFRGYLKLAVYAEDYLEIDFTKQDLNMYIGADEYTVEIKDLQGKIYFTKTYKDDGEKKDTKVLGEEQDFDIKVNALPRNIYYITFTKDKNNPSADSTIKDIKINSNKILILDQSLPWEGFEFYTKVDSQKTIGFKYWWASKTQKIYQTGTKKDTINLDEDWFEKKYEQKLTEKGDYNFKIDVGYLWIYADAISPSKENWFYFPKSADKSLINSDIIIIDKNKLDIRGDNVVYYGQIEVNEDSKFKIQVLDELQIYFKDFKLELL